ncbi:unnamed protein product [marine sediment metagenome]|uniref:Uncharacterized protein n=1 Tax=marine sediment metagenome TaxID=412755 RepID=X1KNH6_9ZZZZ
MNVQEAFVFIEGLRQVYGMGAGKMIKGMRQAYALIGEKAAVYIVRAYMLKPRQTPMLTAAVLDPFLLLPELLYPGQTEYKGFLGMIAEINYTNHVEAAPEDIENFISYFNAVYDIFISGLSKELKQLFKAAGGHESPAEKSNQ